MPSQVMNAETLIQLPDPDEHPQADVVIYDGECRFCQAQVARLARWNRSGKLAFISLHDQRVAERYPDLTHQQLMQDMYVIDHQGHRHRGAAALRYLSRRLPQLWPVAPWLHLPWSLPLWQGIYRQVAKRRYWWNKSDGCETGSCRLHGR